MLSCWKPLRGLALVLVSIVPFVAVAEGHKSIWYHPFFTTIASRGGDRGLRVRCDGIAPYDTLTCQFTQIAVHRVTDTTNLAPAECEIGAFQLTPSKLKRIGPRQWAGNLEGFDCAGLEATGRLEHEANSADLWTVTITRTSKQEDCGEFELKHPMVYSWKFYEPAPFGCRTFKITGR